MPAAAGVAPVAAPAPVMDPANPAAAVSAPVPQDPAQIEQRFAALKRLLDNRMISQDDYDRAKAELLKSMATLPR
jgi:hypothetical protein